MHTSNFRKVKRVEDVVKVFALIADKIPSKLLLIGDGPERTNIELLCRETGVCDRITFLGKQEQIEEILSVCDLFLLPSETESFGLAALEAMACEVPVISTNTGGIPEVNIEGVTGFLSDVGDIESMAKNALYILSDDSILRKFKSNALKQAQEQFISNGIALGSLEYRQFAWSANKDMVLNSFCDSCVFVDNTKLFGLRYREYLEGKEDRDFAMQVIKLGQKTGRTTLFAFSAPAST